MKTALWFVGHGTRDEGGAGEFHAFVDLIQAELQRHFELPTVIPRCYVELQSPSVTDALLSSGASGVQQVVLAPLLLFAAGHRKHDIPEAVKEARVKFPNLTVATLDPMGVDSVFAAVAADRVREICGKEESNGAAVVFVGRGNRDVSAQSEFGQVAAMVQAAVDGPKLTTAYLAGTGTSLEAALTTCATAGARTIYVVPYLLFQGWLTRTLPERLDMWQIDHPTVTIRLGRHLGVDERLTKRMAQRIAKALTTLPNQGTFSLSY